MTDDGEARPGKESGTGGKGNWEEPSHQSINHLTTSYPEQLFFSLSLLVLLTYYFVLPPSLLHTRLACSFALAKRSATTAKLLTK